MVTDKSADEAPELLKDLTTTKFTEAEDSRTHPIVHADESESSVSNAEQSDSHILGLPMLRIMKQTRMTPSILRKMRFWEKCCGWINFSDHVKFPDSNAEVQTGGGGVLRKLMRWQSRETSTFAPVPGHNLSHSSLRRLRFVSREVSARKDTQPVPADQTRRGSPVLQPKR